MFTPDVAHKAVFINLTIIDVKNDRSLKNCFVRVVFPETDPKIDEKGRSKTCVCGWGEERVEKRSCEVCKSVNDISNVKRRDTAETFNTLKWPLDCNSNLIISFIYLFECKQCQYRFHYVGSTKTKFRYRINNYISTHRKFRKKYVEEDLLQLWLRKES